VWRAGKAQLTGTRLYSDALHLECTPDVHLRTSHNDVSTLLCAAATSQADTNVITANCNTVRRLCLCAVGGGMGYRKGSKQSAKYGGITGSLLLLASYLMPKCGMPGTIGFRLALGVTVFLTGVMIMRLRETGKEASLRQGFTPTKGVLALTSLYLSYYIVFCKGQLLG
jgi:uncharacterized membrane protein (UPF0136 family)